MDPKLSGETSSRAAASPAEGGSTDEAFEPPQRYLPCFSDLCNLEHVFTPTLAACALGQVHAFPIQLSHNPPAQGLAVHESS